MKAWMPKKVGVRIVENLVSQKRDRWRPRVRRDFDKIADKILGACGHYDVETKRLDEKITLASMDPRLTKDEREQRLLELNWDMRQLDEGDGEKRVTIHIDDADLDLLKREYEQSDIPGGDRWKKWNRDILDSFDSAKPYEPPKDEPKSTEAAA